MMRVCASVTIGWLCAACAVQVPPPLSPEPAADGAAVAPDRPAPVAHGPVAQTDCFAGQTEARTADGASVGTSEELVERTLDQTEGVIVETVVRGDPRPDVPATEYRLRMRVEDSTYTFEDAGGAFAGTGTLVGEPWHWTGWHSESKLQDGSLVESVDALTASGLHADKKLRSEDGEVRMTFVTDLEAIPCRELAQRRAAMLGTEPETEG